MLTINVIGKNCNVQIDGTLYTVVVNEKFDLSKLKTWGMSYYYNLNQSKEWFDENDTYQTADKRAKFKQAAQSYKDRIAKLVLTEWNNQKTEKKNKDYSKKIEQKKLREEQRLLKEVEKAKFDAFKDFPDLEIKNGSVYLKGLDFVLPDTFLNVIKEERNVQPYINFMYHVAANPNGNIRNSIFDWIHSKGFKITENGYIYAVRWVVKVDEISELTKFVHAEYVKKKLQKKSPKNYSVWEHGYKEDCIGTQYNIVENWKIATEKFQNENYVVVGNLFDLYNTKQELKFTDNHTKTFDIRLGNVVSMDRKDCNENDAECHSSGLHCLSINYALSHSFGDQLVGILISPTDVCSNPRDNYQKFRTCRYYVKDLIDTSVIEEMKNTDLIIDDSDYEEINLKSLYENLVGKEDLFNTNTNQNRIAEIKEKLKSFKGEIPKDISVEEVSVINRLIKL